MKDIEHRIQVYRDRLQHHPDPEMIDFYIHEIERLENEIEADHALLGLLEDCKLIPPWKCVTDKVSTVQNLIDTTEIVSILRKWSWWRFKTVYVVMFYHKKI